MLTGYAGENFKLVLFRNLKYPKRHANVGAIRNELTAKPDIAIVTVQASMS